MARFDPADFPFTFTVEEPPNDLRGPLVSLENSDVMDGVATAVDDMHWLTLTYVTDGFRPSDFVDEESGTLRVFEGVLRSHRHAETAQIRVTEWGHLHWMIHYGGERSATQSVKENVRGGPDKAVEAVLHWLDVVPWDVVDIR